jgi:uncharacterized protein YbbC (DUF1343 family)
MAAVQLGIDNLLASQPDWLRSARIGLLANQASVDNRLRHTQNRLLEAGANLTAIFAPQHGYLGEQQANMIESDNFIDKHLGIPVFSLYSATRQPTDDMLSHIDILVVDLQDVGTRVYTFASTVALCMEAARDHDVKVVVLDRPNPIGGKRSEGNLLDPERSSFVGRFPIPMRHGLTMAELALLFNEVFDIGAPLKVFHLNGWRRSMLHGHTGLYWVPPSPNLPTPESTLVYPGQVILEGTNLSEGRGTTTPFELWGSPYLKPELVTERLDQKDLSGLILRPARFTPSFDKWTGQSCTGFQIHVADPEKYYPYATSLTLVQAILTTHRDEFQWASPPYEYEFHHLPIEIILGSVNLHAQLEAGVSVKDLERSWEPQLLDFRKLCEPYLLYS